MDGDTELIQGLRAGQEQAFVDLVGLYHTSMTRLARTLVHSPEIAEEVVQDTWLAVVKGVSRFEQRSSVRTWIFTILVNRARTVGAREHRHVPVGASQAAVDGSRFDRTGQWRSGLPHWSDEADDRLHAADMAAHIQRALQELPAQQRMVVTLRDVAGLSSGEVCGLLGLSQDNQRVLLHRARSRLRATLESEFEKGHHDAS